MEDRRVSVRELVEFSIHGEDILPAAGKQDMLAGTRGHRARQGALEEGWQAEVPLNLTAEAGSMVFLISGRMDAFWDGEVPVIEELKLCGAHPPEAAIPAHRAQAAVYGHMVCALMGKSAVRLRVAYISEAGALRASFEEELSAQALAAEFSALLSAYAQWQAVLSAHRARRDASIAALPFPFESYRPGQREMAVQVFTAIHAKKRLFASMPTGTGKSAAVLYPAVKALGQGLTGQLFYLTARTTARQAALTAMDLMREKGLHVWSLTLNAKEKQCPGFPRCHPDDCPRAKGHFLRLPAALDKMLETCDWNGQAVMAMADRHQLCPFEFALSLAEIADVVVCDYNYAFDPVARIKRVFEWRTDLTLLADESHNLASRVREMLSGFADGSQIKAYRTLLNKAGRRKSRLYQALTKALSLLRAIPLAEGREETELDALPEGLAPAIEEVLDQVMDAFSDPPPGEAGRLLGDIYQMAAGFTAAVKRGLSNYAPLCVKQGRERRVRLLALSVAEHLDKATRRLCGTVYFSATLSPLTAMRRLLGGGEEDACFALPSPFPRENLLVIRHGVDTRYALRHQTAPRVAEAVLSAFSARPGKYIAFFPSYAYLRMVGTALLTLDPSLPLLIQEGNMEESQREAFLRNFSLDGAPLLGLCVLGGIFAEGIDLPGERLLGVMIVGVGLPMVCLEQEALRRHYESTLDDGFGFAYRYPGMHKVLQAAGRVIRSETDRGVVLLIDNRYFQQEYLRLCPPHWQFEGENLGRFWLRGAAPENPAKGI